MALRETHVDIDFTANADPLRDVNREINNVLRNTTKMGTAYGKLDDNAQKMMKEMKDGFRQQNDAMLEWRSKLIEAEYGFYKLAQGAKESEWGTRRYIQEIKLMGLAHKKATDEMIKNDSRVLMGIYRQIGVMSSMTTLAKKTKDAINLWQNPIYLASMGSLKLLDRMQQIAQNATPAAIALERLGKNANAKELADEIQRLNRGLGALPIAYIAAGLGAIFFYGAIHKAAMKNKEYSDSWKTMLATLRKAIQPMIDVFIMIMVPVYKFITMIAAMIVKFNEAHPTLAKLIQGVLLLVPALTLLLLPMGLGIGLVNGYRLAFGYLMRMIGPVITLFMTLSPVVWVVAAAIVGLTYAFYYLYNNFAWFRNAVNAVFAWLKAQVMAIVAAVMVYVQQVVAKIKAFWTENRAMIMAAVQNILAIAKMLYDGMLPMFRLLFGLLKTIVKTAWDFIQRNFNIAITIILGLVKTFAQIFNGDWKGAWETVKQTTSEVLKLLIGFIKDAFGNIMDFLRDFDLTDVGKDIMLGLWNGMKAMGSKALEYVKDLGKSIKKAMKSVLDINSPSREMFQIGSWTVEGQIDGMESQKRHLQSLSYELAAMPMEYTPESSTTTNTKTSSQTLHFAPQIVVQGSGGDTGGVKQAVSEALDEAFSRWSSIYAVEVEL